LPDGGKEKVSIQGKSGFNKRLPRGREGSQEVLFRQKQGPAWLGNVGGGKGQTWVAGQVGKGVGLWRNQKKLIQKSFILREKDGSSGGEKKIGNVIGAKADRKVRYEKSNATNSPI